MENEIQDLIDAHDCHVSSEDGCICEDYIDELVRLKNKDDLASQYLEHIKKGIFQF